MAQVPIKPSTSETDASPAPPASLPVADDLEALRAALAEERQQRQRLEAVIEAVAPARWEWDIAEHRVQLEPGWAAILGYTLEELAPIDEDTWRNLVHPDDLAASREAMRAHADGLTETYEAVFRMRHRRGYWLWIQSRARIYQRDADGRPLRMAGALSDVSALHQVKRDAAQTRLQLQALIEASDDVAIIATDTEGNISLFNAGAERLLGYRAEEVVGKLTPVAFHVPEQLQARMQLARERLGREPTPFESLNFETVDGTATGDWTFARKDGSRCQVRLSITELRDAAGARVGLFGIAIDLTPIIEAREQARIEAEKFSGAFRAAALGMALVSLEGGWLDVNDALCAMLGYSREQLLRTDFQSLTHPEDLDSDLALLQRLVAGEIESYQMDKRYIAHDGRLVWARLSVSMLRAPDGAPLHFVSQIQDVTLEKTSLQRLRDSEERTRITLDTVLDLVVTLDERGVVQYANAAAQRLLGDETRPSPVGRRIQDVLRMTTEYAPRTVLDLAPLLEEEANAVDLGQDLLLPVNGSLMPIEITRAWLRDTQGRSEGAVWVIRDVTQQRMRQREALRLAEVDPLTELANRRGFDGQLEEALLRLRERGQPSSLIYMDLDGFKAVNDQHGHPAGDLVLERVGRLLKSSVRDLDVVARLGGDEFAAILLGCSLPRAQRIAEDLSSAIKQLAIPYEDGAVLNVGASIGVTALRPDMSGETAVAAVDALCYQAKARGRNNVQVGED